MIDASNHEPGATMFKARVYRDIHGSIVIGWYDAAKVRQHAEAASPMEVAAIAKANNVTLAFFGPNFDSSTGGI